MAEAVFVRGDASVQPEGEGHPAAARRRHGAAHRRPAHRCRRLRHGAFRRQVAPADGRAGHHAEGGPPPEHRGSPAVPDISVQLIEGTSELRVPATSAPAPLECAPRPSTSACAAPSSRAGSTRPANAAASRCSRAAWPRRARRPVCRCPRAAASWPRRVGPSRRPGRCRSPDLAGLPPRVERLPLRPELARHSRRRGLQRPGVRGEHPTSCCSTPPPRRRKPAGPTCPRQPLRAARARSRRRRTRGPRRRPALRAEGPARRPVHARPVPDAKAYGDTVTLSWAQVEVAGGTHVQVAAVPGLRAAVFDREDVSAPPRRCRCRPARTTGGWPASPPAATTARSEIPCASSSRPRSPALEAPQVSPEGLQVALGPVATRADGALPGRRGPRLLAAGGRTAHDGTARGGGHVHAGHLLPARAHDRRRRVRRAVQRHGPAGRSAHARTGGC